MTRQLVVCDIETTSLLDNAAVLEIAAVNVTTREEFRVVPFHSGNTLANADPEALAINRYYERRVFADMLEDADANKNAFDWLRVMLLGNSFAGANPAFDAPKLAKLIGSTPWHYRLVDISAYAAGKLDIPAGELPGLHAVCELLNVTNDDPHSALGDARATAECFRVLADRKK